MTNLLPVQLTCEHRVDPVTDVTQPLLAWQLTSQGRERGVVQTAYQVSVTDAGNETCWDSGKVASSVQQALYSGKPLAAETVYRWQVRVWDAAGTASEWSEPAHFQAGLLGAADWNAQWIACPLPAGEDGLPPVPYLRRSFTLEGKSRRAMLYATARGVYEACLNGKPVSKARLSPGWTDYNRRIEYQAYDVTALLQTGENVLGALLGEGWYAGSLGWGDRRGFYGSHPSFLASLRIELENGQRICIGTDSAWKASAGAILYADLYHGEGQDARREPAGWCCPGFDDSAWQSVTLAEAFQGLLTAQRAPQMCITEEIKPLILNQPRRGVWIYDLGQNMVGWVRLKVSAPAGTRLQLRFSEMLNPDGTLYTTNLRLARNTDVFITKGEGEEIFEPHFTYHGFRYVELTGLPGDPTLDMITGCVVHSDLPAAGSFSCSDDLVNRLWLNVLWGQRGNFLAVPTDCPQRNERLGWTGDAQIFARTACYNLDCAAYLDKWLDDVIDGQTDEGAFPDVAPKVVVTTDGAPAWGEVGIILPWTLYQMYGDRRILERAYPAMERWMDYLQKANPDMLRTRRLNNNYGDWVSLDPNTSKELAATAYWAYDARLMSQMAAALGKTADAEKYQQVFEQVKAAFIKEYVKPDGSVKGETQTSYVLALYMDLLPEALRPLAAKRLASDIYNRGGHLSTGFIGTGYLLPTLAENGYLGLAHRLLVEDTYPSWGYPIRQGATTIWERWDGWTAHNGFQDPGMNSFNHFAFGVVAEWLYRSVAGIDLDPQHPGFEQIVIRPQPGGSLTFVRAAYQSVRGEIRSEWRDSSEDFALDVTIPVNTTARICLPFAGRVSESGKPVVKVEGVRGLEPENGKPVLLVGSGTYHFYVAKAGGYATCDQ